MNEMIILTVPPDISERAREIAATIEQPVEDVLIAHLQTLRVTTLRLPDDEERELEALNLLSDDALWTIAREQMPDEVQERAHVLMEKNSSAVITEVEYAELEQLVRRADRLMLRKAEAAAILRQRGWAFTQANFKASDE